PDQEDRHLTTSYGVRRAVRTATIVRGAAALGITTAIHRFDVVRNGLRRAELRASTLRRIRRNRATGNCRNARVVRERSSTEYTDARETAGRVQEVNHLLIVHLRTNHPHRHLGAGDRIRRLEVRAGL